MREGGFLCDLTHSSNYIYLMYFVYFVGEEYVKAVLHDGRLQGAVLIGETDSTLVREGVIRYLLLFEQYLNGNSHVQIHFGI